MMIQPRIQDRFRSQAVAECDYAHRRTGDDGWRTEKCILATELQLRMREYHLRVKPLIALLCRIPPVGGVSLITGPGDRFERIEHWSDEQRKLIDSIERQMAFHRGECGLGPPVELPPLMALIGSRD